MINDQIALKESSTSAVSRQEICSHLGCALHQGLCQELVASQAPGVAVHVVRVQVVAVHVVHIHVIPIDVVHVHVVVINVSVHIVIVLDVVVVHIATHYCGVDVDSAIPVIHIHAVNVNVTGAGGYRRMVLAKWLLLKRSLLY